MEVTISSLGNVKDKVAAAVSGFKGPSLHYADLRLEVFEGRGAGAIKGNMRGAGEDYGIEIGTRAYAKSGKFFAAGMCGRVLGKEQLEHADKQAKEMLKIALSRARANLKSKAMLAKKYPKFGKSLTGGRLADVKVYNDTVGAEFKKDPRDFSLEEMSKRAEEISANLQKIDGIATNSVGMVAGMGRKIFASTEGALIDQSRALTDAYIFVAANGKAMETFGESVGDFAGIEVFDGENPYGKTIEEFAEFIARGTIEVSNAPAMKATENVTVITDPWYNSLLSHEITGHPSEADRALKREAAWAGRAWWFTGIDNNKFGQEVASKEVTVFSDPTIKGFGHYKYDDEGVKGKKILNIDKGILNEFLNSRETAAVLGREPNGGMRACSADMVPIVRMNNTCFAPGTWKKDELFKETRNGYYAVGSKTPSIGETRQNFKITCWKLYKIENGEQTQLYRMGGVTGDSYQFLKSIDAVADDFMLYNIPNCGKGTPMQTMKVGNGGPHIRGMATVSGAHMMGE